MKKIIFILTVCVMAFTLNSCEKGDGDADYGYAKIYIPEATVSGGIDNYYAVPSGGGEYTYNFRVENGNLNIILGVYRSGTFSTNDAYTVDIVVLNTESTAAAAAKSGEVMPSTLYTLPSKVNVESGEVSNSFYLTIDAATLEQAQYSGKKLVLCVGIANPTAYSLSDVNTSVNVVLDVDAITAFL